jgi:hypothetical protein
MRQRLTTPNGNALYKLRERTVEPASGQIMGSRGFCQFFRRGQREAVESEGSLLCTARGLLEFHQAKLGAKSPRFLAPMHS